MFRSLSFLAMGQEEHQAAGLVPLLLRAREELVDDHLAPLAKSPNWASQSTRVDGSATE